ncbi:hypothetical protein [Microbulbifer epialgicus]|uniref:Uncharacterized protein n=1 Tax=Microbulbifer epialgicus TaxID=393907 RepID=A0ABV4P4S5_9GAMM
MDGETGDQENVEAVSFLGVRIERKYQWTPELFEKERSPLGDCAPFATNVPADNQV